jgi:hypothetical protein
MILSQERSLEHQVRHRETSGATLPKTELSLALRGDDGRAYIPALPPGVAARVLSQEFLSETPSEVFVN